MNVAVAGRAENVVMEVAEERNQGTETQRQDQPAFKGQISRKVMKKRNGGKATREGVRAKTTNCRDVHIKSV